MDSVPVSRWRRPSLGGRRKTVAVSQLPAWYAILQSHLSEARVSILNQILTDSDAKLNVKSTSRLLISNTDIASTLLQWYRGTEGHSINAPDMVIAREYAETTELTDDLEATGNSIFRLLDEVVSREGRFTHAVVFVDSERDDKEVVGMLKTVLKALTPETGIMVLFRNRTDSVAEVLQATGVKHDDVPIPGSRPKSRSGEDALIALAEEAGFDRQNVLQSFSKQYNIKAPETENLTSQLETALAGSMETCADGEGWKADLKGAVERVVTRDGGLLVSADVSVLKK